MNKNIFKQSPAPQVGEAHDDDGDETCSPGYSVDGNDVVDLRSDTVTLPTPEMYERMAEAPLGDDVLGHDPTTLELEETVAVLLGKEAAIFVPSGTMANLIAVMVHAERRGSEIVLGDKSHMHLYEQGGVSTIAHVHPRPIPNQPDGTLLLQDIEDAIRVNDDHFPVTRLLCLENTQNACGGKVLTVDYMDSVGVLAKKYFLKLHVDGARLANAAAALGVTCARLVRAADSVSFCLSKGLAAPVGSLLAGTKDFIALARRMRKALGGGMRQSGVLAAAGLVSVETMLPRIGNDNETAHMLALSLSHISGLDVDIEGCESNMVMVDVDTERYDFDVLTKNLNLNGIRVIAKSHGRYRLVTHYHVTSLHVDQIVAAFRSCLEESEVDDQ